jgi:hypothetical protein
MKYLLLLCCCFMLAPWLPAMGRAGGGPSLTWLVEGDEFEGPKMVRRDVAPAPDGKVHFFRVTPMVTQNHVRGMIPRQAEDGSWGATFILNEDGWRSIQATAALDSGRLVRVYINGRPLEFQRVEKPTTDDHLIVIWGGITDAEMNQLKSKYKQAPTKKR